MLSSWWQINLSWALLESKSNGSSNNDKNCIFYYGIIWYSSTLTQSAFEFLWLFGYINDWFEFFFCFLCTDPFLWRLSRTPAHILCQFASFWLSFLILCIQWPLQIVQLMLKYGINVEQSYDKKKVSLSAINCWVNYCRYFKSRQRLMAHLLSTVWKRSNKVKKTTTLMEWQRSPMQWLIWHSIEPIANFRYFFHSVHFIHFIRCYL